MFSAQSAFAPVNCLSIRENALNIFFRCEKANRTLKTSEETIDKKYSLVFSFIIESDISSSSLRTRTKLEDN